MKSAIISSLVLASVALAQAQTVPTNAWQFSDVGPVTKYGTIALGYFDGPSGATALATQYGLATSFGLPTIGGKDPVVMQFPACNAAMGYSYDRTAAQATGFTMVLDILWPAASSAAWRSLFQTDGNNTTDGDFFLNGADGIGIDNQYDGTVAANTWVRVGATFMPSTTNDGYATVTRYLNGSKLGAKDTMNVSARFELGPKVMFFTDNDGETKLGYCAKIMMFESVLSDTEMTALGSPSADMADVADWSQF